MSTSLARHLEKLCVELGARPIGSPANNHAADYIRDVFARAGLGGGRTGLCLHRLGLRLQSLAIGDKALAVEANAFSPACDVTAPAVPAATLDELAAADLTGKIALLHGELVAEPLSAKSWFLRGERDDAIIGLLEAKRPAAVLAPPPATIQYEQFTGDWELEISAATAPRGGDRASAGSTWRPPPAARLCEARSDRPLRRRTQTWSPAARAFPRGAWP